MQPFERDNLLLISSTLTQWMLTILFTLMTSTVFNQRLDFQWTAFEHIKRGEFTHLADLISTPALSVLRPLLLLTGWNYCFSCNKAESLIQALWNDEVSCEFVHFFQYFYWIQPTDVLHANMSKSRHKGIPL